MALTCKNCGGNISLDPNANLIICEYCGAKQALADILVNGSDNLICNGLSISSLNTYKRAVSMMSSARTENSFLSAASVFDEIHDVLDANDLAKKCRDEADKLKTERLYNTAIANMKSNDPRIIEDAIMAFQSLGDYKDAATKIEECMPLLNAAKAAYQEKLNTEAERRAKEEKLKQLYKEKKDKINKIVLYALIALSVIFLIGRIQAYSRSNIKITMSPDAENYLTESYNKYVFHYDVNVKNKGLFAVNYIAGEVIIEKDNEVLVDTTFYFSSSSGALVRAKKHRKFGWELSVQSYDTARMLFLTDFDDLDVKIKITEITYKNGKTKTY